MGQIDVSRVMADVRARANAALYCMDNFERQAQINRVMFAALQALAIENAKRRKRDSSAA